jgi:hypothetical protein
MSTLLIQTDTGSQDLVTLIRDAIRAEVTRLELALEVAQKRLAVFETRYGVSSAQFADQWTAEDLEGGDDEYVTWAGEYKLTQRLRQKLEQLREVTVR